MKRHPAGVHSNPVYSGYFADPFVWRVGNEYYAIGTGALEAGGQLPAADGAAVFPLLRSLDLLTWSEAGRALVPPDPLLGDSFWAPEIATEHGIWYLYYSVGFQDRLHQLRVATSNHPLGPYVDRGPLTFLSQCAFAIDPHPFRDVDGRWYLFHARDFLDETDEDGRVARPGTALVVHRLISMTELDPVGVTVARARCEWQCFMANRSMYGAVYDWHTLEGPCVARHDGRYYCLYSGGCWQNDTYGVDYVVADSISGPYSDRGSEAGPRILATIPGHVIGPGHCSLVQTTQAEWRMAYHAWDAAMVARRMHIVPLDFTSEGPRARMTQADPKATGAEVA